jgi:hypothetical protein
MASVVEGHGEVEALPTLIRRIADSVGYVGDLRVNPPIRVKSGSFLKDEDYFRKYVALAAAKAVTHGGSLLILLDCEDDCPGTLGPALCKGLKQFARVSTSSLHSHIGNMRLGSSARHHRCAADAACRKTSTLRRMQSRSAMPKVGLVTA